MSASIASASVASLLNQFQSLNQLPRDVAKAMTLEVLRPSGLSVPVLNYTPTGLVACIRAGGKATIAKITKKDDVSWSHAQSGLSPISAYAFNELFQRDTALTITTIFGEDYWNNYRSAIVKRAGGNTSETVVKMVFALVAGDLLYWRMTGQVYMDAMENESNEGKVLCLAKKAQIAFTQAEVSQNLLKSVCPCEVSITVV
jgi:hypothetical protein